MLIATAFVSPVLFYAWNSGLVHFVNFATPISWWDAVVVLFACQLIPFWMVRRVEIKYIPIATNVLEAHEQEVAEALENV